MTSVLLTRGAAENESLKLELAGKDFDFIDCPLIEYEDAEIVFDEICKYSNIIITSKHAAKILAKHRESFENHTRFFVVGELSAEILRSSGLDIACVGVDVDDLIVQIPENLQKDAIYLSSNEITQELPKLIKRHVIYKVKYKSVLNSKEIELLNNKVDYILLYSQNSAKTLMKLLEAENLIKTLQNTTILAISTKVAKEVLPYFKKIIYCEKGEHKKMIELLLSHAAKSGKFKEAD